MTERNLWSDRTLKRRFYTRNLVDKLLSDLLATVTALLTGKRDSGPIDGGTP